MIFWRLLPTAFSSLRERIIHVSLRTSCASRLHLHVRVARRSAAMRSDSGNSHPRKIRSEKFPMPYFVAVRQNRNEGAVATSQR